MILKWNLVFLTYFIEYLYFTLGGPFKGSPRTKNQFYVETIFIIYGGHYIAFLSKNIFNNTHEKHKKHKNL